MSNLPHTVKRTVVLDAPAARVWEALTEEALLSEWLAPEVKLIEEAERLTPAAPLLAATWAPRLRRLPLALGRLALA